MLQDLLCVSQEGARFFLQRLFRRHSVLKVRQTINAFEAKCEALKP